MMSFRPRTSRYLARPRLLSLLPEKPGSVIWLEAPYGYGKSVLASQWAATLEAEHWRVIWLAADAQGVRRTVADGLSLPPESPWGAVLSTLWSEPTVLVLEDLENLSDHEELVPLLRDPRGLLLLASRGPLRTSEIPRLFTAGRLTHLRSAQLGFTEQEAALLMADTAGWQRCGSRRAAGLPLHSPPSGEPRRQQPLSGLRGSLPPPNGGSAAAHPPDLPADAGTKEPRAWPATASPRRVPAPCSVGRASWRTTRPALSALKAAPRRAPALRRALETGRRDRPGAATG